MDVLLAGVVGVKVRPFYQGFEFVIDNVKLGHPGGFREITGEKKIKGVGMHAGPEVVVACVLRT
jgi:hypothetical protein